MVYVDRAARSAAVRPFLLALLVCLASLAPGPVQAQSGGITHVYDELGRLVGVIDPAGDTVRYAYDAAGNLLTTSRASSSLVSVIEFTPDGGPVGATVTIYGTGFAATPSQNTVTFNGVSATVTSASATRLVTTVPTSATTGAISVTTSAGTATSSASFTVSGTGVPSITSFTPTSGAAGTAVTVTGTNFETTAANNRVKFNLGTPTPPRPPPRASPPASRY